MGATVNESIC